MKYMNSKKGFTLIELLVYMAIVGIVVVIAGQVYSDNTKMRVRTQNMLAAGELAENTAALIRDDLAQMGAKTKKGDVDYEILDDVMMKPIDDLYVPDSSSFAYHLIKGKKKGDEQLYSDAIDFRRAYYENGTFKRVEEVSWSLDDGTLYRSCKTISGTADESLCPEAADADNLPKVAIATGVTNFMLTPAKPSNLSAGSGTGSVSVDGRMFPGTDESVKAFRMIAYGGTDFFAKANSMPNLSTGTVTLSGFSTNYQSSGAAVVHPVKHQYYVADGDASEDSWTNCHEFSFEKDQEYEITFNMNNMTDRSRMFRPNIDHMAVGIRKTGDATPGKYESVTDYLFYPPEDSDGYGTRSMRFSFNETGNGPFTGCVAFTFVFYSPTVSAGSFAITNLVVRKVVDSDYTFEDNYQPNVYDRKNVRAFRLKLDLEKGRENGHAEMVIPVPSNGTKG